MGKEKVLITGSKGFIGRNLTLKLSDKYTIVQINEDIFDNDNWHKLLDEQLNELELKAVFHVGAVSNTLEKDVNYMMIRNYEFTKRLVDFCTKKSTPIIYSSSAACYGINNEYPSNLYGWSKYAAEQYVILNRGVALRYFNVYGPGEDDKGKMASVAYQMWKNNLKRNEIKLFPGNPKRDFVFIDDVVYANVYAFEYYDKLKSKYFEVGSGQARSFEDVLNNLQISYSYTEQSDVPKGYQFYTKSDNKKWMPGWEPKYDLESGLKLYKNYLL